MLELVVSMALLLLLTGALFASWILASRSWTMAFRSTSRLGSLELALTHLQNHVQDCSAQAAIYQNDPATPALAFPSASGLTSSGQNLEYHYQPGQAAPLWQKYGVYYLAGDALNYQEIPIPPGDPASFTATSLALWNGPLGVHPLEDYCRGGKQLFSPVDVLQVERTVGLLYVTLGSPGAIRGPGSGRLTLTQSIFLHN